MDMVDINALIGWIAQHPHWAYATVFFAALTESVVLVGLFVPGALVMFGVAWVSSWSPVRWTCGPRRHERFPGALYRTNTSRDAGGGGRHWR
jgi:hypothetical protein